MRVNSITIATVQTQTFAGLIQESVCQWPSIAITPEIASTISDIMSQDRTPDLSEKMGVLALMLDEFCDEYQDPRNSQQSGSYWAGEYEVGWTAGRPFLRLKATVGRTVTIKSCYSNLNGWLSIEIDFGKGGSSSCLSVAVIKSLLKFEGKLDYIYINASGNQPRGACNSLKEMLSLLTAEE